MVRPKATLPLICTLALLLMASVVPRTSAYQAGVSLSLGDFDVVAFKYDVGESVADTAIGVDAKPAPVSGGAVNLMLVNDVVPLYMTEGPSDAGVVAFGFVEGTVWTPVSGDGNDLMVHSNPIGDRVYATVDGSGQVTLVSAANLQEGTVVDTETVRLDPNKAFRLVIEPEFDWAYVYYGGKVIASGDPFPGGSGASRANLGSDMVISILSGATGSGSATINDLARSPKLRVHEFPRVLAEWNSTPPVKITRVADILLADERAALAIYLTNVGSEIARNVRVTLSAPTGAGIRVDEPRARSYGDIPPRGSVFRTFTVETSSTPAGVYPLTLTVTGGLSQTLTTFIAVWDVRTTIVDAAAGHDEAAAVTPFGKSFISITAPEVFDANGDPSYFDIKTVSHKVVHTVPFSGVHRGDVETIGPAPTVITRIEGPGNDRASRSLAFRRHHQTTLKSNTLGLPGSKSLTRDGALESAGLAKKRSAVQVGLVEGKVVKQDTSATPVAGAVVHLIALDTGGKVDTDTTGADGSYSLGPATYGGYKLQLLPPRSLRRSSPPGMSGPFELVEPRLTMDDWALPCPPAGSSPDPESTPPIGQGATGVPPSATNTPATEDEGGLGTGGSAVAGFTTGVILDLINLGLGPETFGATLASIFVGNLGGAGVGVAVDPENTDLFFVGQLNTPPLDSSELTVEESVDVTVVVDPPLSFSTPSTVTTSFTYTRTTDSRSYTYSGTEALRFNRFLLLTLQTSKLSSGSGDDLLITASPRTAGGERLQGPDVLIKAWLLSGSGKHAIGEILLRDDGQAPDADIGDGVYSGALTPSCTVDGFRVIAVASRGGFLADSYPPSHGLVRRVVDQGLFLRRRDLQSGSGIHAGGAGGDPRVGGRWTTRHGVVVVCGDQSGGRRLVQQRLSWASPENVCFRTPHRRKVFACTTLVQDGG